MPPQPIFGTQIEHDRAEASTGTFDTHSFNVFAAPSKFLGDLSAYAGGSLSFDLSNDMFDAPAMLALYPTLVLRSGGSFLGWFGGPPSTTPTSFSAALAASPAWRKTTLASGGLFVQAVMAADFGMLLPAVDGMFINADWKTAGNDYGQLDNVRLAAAGARAGERGAAARRAAGAGRPRDAARRQGLNPHSRRPALQPIRLRHFP